MTWNEQAETMAKAWTEAQKKLWEDWYNLSQSTPGSTPNYADVTSQWQDMATQGFEIWTANADATAKNVTKRLFESQKAMMRFFEFTTNAWKAIAEKVEAGEDWQSVLAEYTTQLQQELIRWPEMAYNMSQDSGKLWQAYMEETQNLTLPWMKSWAQASEHFGQNGTGGLELTRLYWETYEQTFGRFLESPSLGYTREFDEKVHQGFNAWQRYRRADFEYQLVVAEAWVNLFEAFQRKLVAMTEKGESIQSLEDLANLWMNTADPVFIEVFRSEKYIQAQDKLLAETMTYRIQQREITELLLKLYDIPTRTEVDEAHRSAYNMRKEIKSLKKALVEIQKVDTSAGLDEAHQTIATLQKEVKTLKASLAQLAKDAKQIDGLRQEVEALKQTTAKAAAPAKAKRATRSSRSPSKKKKAATAKTSNSEEGS